MSKSILLKPILLISFFTLCSRILGLIRDMLIANLLGAAASADLFIFANRIPNLFRRLFAEGSFSQAFTPVMVEKYDNNNIDKTREFIANISGALFLILSFVTTIGIIFSSVFVIIFAYGWYQDYLNGDTYNYQHASLLLKITFPYLLFISLTALSGAMLNVIKKFSVQAFTPIILNISIIIAAYFFSDYFYDKNIALATGVFVGGLFQLLFQLPFLYRYKLLVWPKFNNLKSDSNKEILSLMLPSLIGTSASQINILVNTLISSFLVTGSISWLYYSERLLELPLGIFGVAISTVLLPNLVRLRNKYKVSQSIEDKQNIHKVVEWGVTLVLLVGAPSTVGLIFLGKYLINLIFAHGQFTEIDVNNSYIALLFFSISIVFSMLIKIFANVFYSNKNTKLPMYIALIAITVNILVDLFALSYGYWVLALATSISTIVNSSLLYIFLYRSGFYKFTKQTYINFLRILLSAIVMAVVLHFILPTYSSWLDSTAIIKVCKMVLYVLISITSYFISLFILRFSKQDILG